MTKTNLQRRTFLSAGAAGAALALAARPRGADAACVDTMPAKWDETFDIIVVGSGFAGLAAAAEAIDGGASVVVLEKMTALGGNSVINGGLFGVPGSEQQKAMGIKDSPELLAEDMLRECLGYNYPDKVRYMAEHTLETYEWTVKTLGVAYIQGQVNAEGGHSVPRCVVTKNGSGSEIVKKQLAYLEKKKAEIRNRVYVEAIVRDGDGRVKGLKVREGYRFPKEGSGKVRYYCARKAIILCHGGFGADVKYRMKHDPKLTDKFDTTCQPGATSELWREAARIGASLVQCDWIQCGPWTSPEEKGFGIALYFANGCAGSCGIWVNCTTGKRFVNEMVNRKIRADAIINAGNKGDRASPSPTRPPSKRRSRSRARASSRISSKRASSTSLRRSPTLPRHTAFRSMRLRSPSPTTTMRSAARARTKWAATSSRRRSPWRSTAVLGTPQSSRPRCTTRWAASKPTNSAVRSASRTTNRFRGFMPRVKRRAACTAPCGWVPAPLSTVL